jgi:hypothetical protein
VNAQKAETLFSQDKKFAPPSSLIPNHLAIFVRTTRSRHGEIAKERKIHFLVGSQLTSHRLPKKKAEDVVEDDPETLLKRLVEEEEEHTENARYILAVMLERKKLLRETDTQEIPSGILRIYEHRKSGDVYIIKDPQISLTDVDRVQEEVRQLLDPSTTVDDEPAENLEPTDGASIENSTNPQPRPKNKEEEAALETKNTDEVE